MIEPITKLQGERITLFFYFLDLLPLDWSVEDYWVSVEVLIGEDDAPSEMVYGDPSFSLTTKTLTQQIEAGTPGVIYRVRGEIVCNRGRLQREVKLAVLPSSAILPWDWEPEPPEEIVVTGDMPDGFVGDTVSTQYSATGGTPPYTYSQFSGTLPPGMSNISSSGLSEGEYTTANSYAFRVQARDVNGLVGYLDDTVLVVEPPPDPDPKLLTFSYRYAGEVTALTQIAGSAFGLEISAAAGRRCAASNSQGGVIAYMNYYDGTNDFYFARWDGSDFVTQTITGYVYIPVGTSPIFAITPDGSWIAVSRNSSPNHYIYTYKYMGSDTYELYSTYTFSSTYAVTGMRFNTAGNTLAAHCQGSEGKLRVLDLDTVTGVLSPSWSVNTGYGSFGVDWYGSNVLVADSSAVKIEIYSNVTHARVAYTTNGTDGALGVFFSPDGTIVYTVTDDDNVQVYTFNGVTIALSSTQAIGIPVTQVDMNSAKTGIFVASPSANYCRVFSVSGTTVTNLGNLPQSLREVLWTNL